MEEPVVDPVQQEQLRQYREEQRRRHAQVSHESHSEPNRTQTEHVQSPMPETVTHTNTSRPPVTFPEPSAPPPDSYDSPQRNLYPVVDNSDWRKKSQEEDDEKLARLLQEQEQEENVAITPPPLFDSHAFPSGPPSPVEPTEYTEDDEQLARAIQESENAQQQQQQQSQRSNQPTTSTQAPAQSGGILSTLGTLSRGLYNAYTTYSQAHQQLQQDAEEHAREINTASMQVNDDEEIARQMQQEEDAAAEAQQPRTQVPLRQPPRRQPASVQFMYRTPSSQFSPFGYDSDDEEDNRIPGFHGLGSNPSHQLMTLNSLFRTAGASPEEPLFRHLQELMQFQRNRRSEDEMMHSELPRHRYAFPQPAFRAEGVQQLPPDLLNMMQGQTDTSYESLLELAERMQPVSRGANNQQIDQLPTRTFTAGSMPPDLCKCGICLADYEQGEELTSLPCLHSFHKTCITHWLGINKICPVCRAEIPGAEQQQD